MSSILKAIRKIEDEKRSGENHAPDLMVDHGQNAKKPLTILPLISGAVLGAVAVGGLLLWAQDSKIQVVESDHKASQRPAAGVSLHASAKDEQTATLKSVVSESKPPIVTPMQNEAVKVETLPPEAIPESAASKLPRDDRTKSESKQAASQLLPIVQGSKSPPKLPGGISLLVSEIFYQEDSANSLAVVNDLPVMLGTQIESAVVSEIHPDHVVFKIDGKPYSVSPDQP